MNLDTFVLYTVLILLPPPPPSGATAGSFDTKASVLFKEVPGAVEKDCPRVTADAQERARKTFSNRPYLYITQCFSKKDWVQMTSAPL